MVCDQLRADLIIHWITWDRMGQPIIFANDSQVAFFSGLDPRAYVQIVIILNWAGRVTGALCQCRTHSHGGGHPFFGGGLRRCACACWVDKFTARYYRSGMSGALHTMPDQDLRELLLLEEQLKKLDTREAAQSNFMAYVDHVYII